MGADVDNASGRFTRADIKYAKRSIDESMSWLATRDGSKRLYAAHSKDPLVEAMNMRFTQLRDERAWEHGHGGYTGTFAEKHDITVITLAKDLTDRQWKTFRAMVRDGMMRWNEKSYSMVLRAPLGPERTLMKKLGITQRHVQEMYRVLEDKWGPALGVVTPNGSYWMTGYCSS